MILDAVENEVHLSQQKLLGGTLVLLTRVGHSRYSQTWQTCPYCGGGWIFRVRRRGLVDGLLSFLGLRPFWCEECGAKFHTRPEAHLGIQQTLPNEMSVGRTND